MSAEARPEFVGSECAAPACSIRISSKFMMCRQHWFQVPKPIRDEVWRAFKEEGVLSDAYLDAYEAAVASVTP